MRGISRMNWLVSYCTARLILVTWSRPNLIIGLIFSRWKKGPIRKENSVECLLQVLQELKLFPGILKYLGRVKYYTSHQPCVHRYGYPHHHSTNSYEPIRFLQTSQNRLINIHRKSLKHISQSALFGFSKNIGHDQIWYENSVVFKAVQWLFMIKERLCKLCYIVDS